MKGPTAESAGELDHFRRPSDETLAEWASEDDPVLLVPREDPEPFIFRRAEDAAGLDPVDLADIGGLRNEGIECNEPCSDA